MDVSRLTDDLFGLFQMLSHFLHLLIFENYVTYVMQVKIHNASKKIYPFLFYSFM